MKRRKRKKKKKMIRITKKEKEILEYLILHGPTWYYELSEKRKIASNKTVLATFRHLDGLLLEPKKKQESYSPGLMGRKRGYYGLTFRGLHYILTNNFLTEEVKERIYDNIKDVIRNQRIEMPKFEGKEYRKMVRKTVPVTKPFFAVMGSEGFRKILSFIVENHPRKFFECLTVNPLTKNRRNFLHHTFFAMMVTLTKIDLSEGAFIDLIGGDSFRVLQPTMGVLGSKEQVLKRLPPKLRKRAKIMLKEIED